MRKSNRIWRIEIKLIFRINYSENIFNIIIPKKVIRITIVTLMDNMCYLILIVYIS